MYLKLPMMGGDPRQVANVVNLLMDGKSNNTGSVTLTPSSATTTLTDARIGPNSVILFMPQTAHASAVSIYVTNRDNGVATLHHPSDANTDKTFSYCVIG